MMPASFRKLQADAARAFGGIVELKADELEERKAQAKRELILYGLGFIVILGMATFGGDSWTSTALVGFAIAVNSVLMAQAERRYKVAAILLDLLEEW